MQKTTPGIAVVTRSTRLEGLRRRWGTLGNAKFRMQLAQVQENVARAKQQQSPVDLDDNDAAFSAYEEEDEVYQSAVDEIERQLQVGLPIRKVDRSYLSTFDFGLASVVVVIGQDGLVANVAKYVGNLPIIAVNPDPTRIDGVLLPFRVDQIGAALRRVLAKRSTIQRITLAEVELNDGQKMLAFNDLFIGVSSHVSARYVLDAGGRRESQSSSGILISTGVGSTGWLSSVFNMSRGISQLLGGQLPPPPRMHAEDRRLAWVVREPFISRQSEAGLVAGFLEEGQELSIESLMPENGVIFSDGVEADFLPFQSGSIARVRVSKQCAHLVKSS